MFLNKQIIIRYFFCIIFLLIFSINSVLAFDIPSWAELQKNKFGLTNTADLSGFNVSADINTAPTFARITGQVIGLVLSLLGIIFMILIIYSGFLWMTARGNEESAQKAKDIMTNALIGAAIVFGAYALTNFIINNLYLATKLPTS